jgi:tRNA (guanine-N7-)-methyltransferase
LDSRLRGNDKKVKKIDYKKYPLPRVRHHANPVLYFPLKQHKVKDINYPPLINSVDWKELFVNGKPPALLDVGCGFGKFLAEMSVENPAKNLLGFELRQSAVEWTNTVINGEGIGNAKALWYSAVNGFPFIETSSTEKIFYFFPDPWVKKRHHKRRAFSTELLDEFARVLKRDGTLYIMTDVPEVDEYQKEVLAQHNGFTFTYTDEKEWKLNIKTYQEQFCINKDIPFIRMICKKKK